MAKFSTLRPSPPTANAKSASTRTQVSSTMKRFKILPEPYRVARYGASKNQLALTFDDGPDPAVDARNSRHPQSANTLRQLSSLSEFRPKNSPTLPSASIAKATRSATTPSPIPISATSAQVTCASSSILPSNSSPAASAFALCCSAHPTRWTPSPIPKIRSGRSNLLRAWATSPSATSSIPKTGTTCRRSTPQQIAAEVLDHLPPCKPNDQQRCGNIILMHDGGGNRERTVLALPLIIEGARARGFQFVPVYQLLGQNQSRRHAPLAHQ